MADRHLNLFYSYNQSREAELIENNLTRAFIQVLRALSGPVRNRLLRSLFSSRPESATLASYDYERAETALQDNMDDAVSKKCAGKHVIAIATRRPDEESDDGTQQHDVEGSSKPDAWIYDGQKHEFCLLIECKRGGNEIDPEQLQRHARRWFGMDAADVHRVDLTWQYVLKVVEQEQQLAQKDNQHEREYVLSGFIGFLQEFGYRLFKGFHFADLRDVPGFRLANTRTKSSERGGLFHFTSLGPPPDFRLRTAAAGLRTAKHRLFCFEELGTAPRFRLRTRKGDNHGR